MLQKLHNPENNSHVSVYLACPVNRCMLIAYIGDYVLWRNILCGIFPALSDYMRRSLYIRQDQRVKIGRIKHNILKEHA